MADRRMVPSKIWDDDRFSPLKAHEKLLYLALISFADDEGCFRADADYWRRKVFYMNRIGASKVDLMLKAIQESRLIVLGDTKKGLAGYHPEWHEFQTLRKDRSKASDFSELLVANGLSPRFQHATEVRSDQIRKEEVNSDDENLGFIRT